MKAVIARVTDEELAVRRRTGIDRWDEMWEGVLHMPPAPNYEHQRMLDSLIIVLAPLLDETKRGTLRSGSSGKKVTSRKQAIAIGLSEARRSGAKVPKKKK